MSKIASDLHNLGESRKKSGGITIEDSPEKPEQAPVVSEHKGFYLLSILLIFLIGISAFSMSVSMKTYSQLETSWADSKVIIQTLNRQGEDIQALQALIVDNSSEELAQIGGINTQIKDLNDSIEERKEELDELKVAHNEMKADVERSIDKLIIADDLILKKYSLLNQKVRDAVKYNDSLLNTY